MRFIKRSRALSKYQQCQDSDLLIPEKLPDLMTALKKFLTNYSFYADHTEQKAFRIGQSVKLRDS